MMKLLLLCSMFAYQVICEECQDGEKVRLQKGLKMRCVAGKWTPVQRRASPKGPPCEDDPALEANGTCSTNQGSCRQFTVKGAEMDRDCAGTCNSCDGCRCQDNHQWHQYCHFWAQYCNNQGVLGNWMTTNCRKTCGHCKCPCCSYQGKQHALGARILLPEKCGELMCEEGLVAGTSPLLSGAAQHSVSHPEELTLNFRAVHAGADCCVLPGDARSGDGSSVKNGTMVEEGWTGSIVMPEGSIQSTCCHGSLSVALKDVGGFLTTTTSNTTTTSTTSTSTTTTSPSTKSTTSCGPEDVTVAVSGAIYGGATFPVENLLIHDEKEIVDSTGTNYWLTPDRVSTSFILNIGCTQIFEGIRVVNVHNRGHKDRSTKRFRLSVSKKQSGPWKQVLDTELEDSRNQKDPLPLQLISLDTKATGQFVKFELLSWWGHGGGLMFFDIQYCYWWLDCQVKTWNHFLYLYIIYVWPDLFRHFIFKKQNSTKKQVNY